jgi:hypothetical protein
VRNGRGKCLKHVDVSQILNGKSSLSKKLEVCAIFLCCAVLE